MNYIENMREEGKELHTKIFNLQSFIYDDPLYTELSAVEQGLLTAQLDYMSSYLNVLVKRITLAEEKA